MKKKTSKLKKPMAQNRFVSGSATTVGISSNGITSSGTTKISGWFTDNFRTYYVDESGKKHYR